MAGGDTALLALVQRILDDAAAASRLLVAAPSLARARIADGATRRAAKAHYLDAIDHYVYAGDTTLYIAARARAALAKL